MYPPSLLGAIPLAPFTFTLFNQDNPHGVKLFLGELCSEIGRLRLKIYRCGKQNNIDVLNPSALQKVFIYHHVGVYDHWEEHTEPSFEHIHVLIMDSSPLSSY